MGAKEVLHPESLQNILDGVGDGVFFVDRERRITWWNHAAELQSGYSAEEMVGKRCVNGQLSHCDATGRSCCGNDCPLDAVLQGHQPETCQVYIRCKNGSRVPVAVSAYPMVNDRGEVVGVAEIFRTRQTTPSLLDQAARQHADAYLDPVTGVPNRRFGELCLQQMLAHPSHFHHSGALIFLDVDHFKQVNDRYGHLAGDAALQAVAQTLRGAVRGNDLVCRWGGEEFLILLSAISREQLIEIAERCRVLVAQAACPTGEHTIRVTCSVGAAMLLPEDQMSSLIARADAAMYAAKHQGRNRVCLAPDTTPSAGIPEPPRKRPYPQDLALVSLQRRLSDLP